MPQPQYPRKWKLSEKKTTWNHNTDVIMRSAKRVNFSFSSKFWGTAKKIIGKYLLTVRAEFRPTTGLTILRDAIKINENQISPTYSSVCYYEKTRATPLPLPLLSSPFHIGVGDWPFHVREKVFCRPRPTFSKVAFHVLGLGNVDQMYLRGK